MGQRVFGIETNKPEQLFNILDVLASGSAVTVAANDGIVKTANVSVGDTLQLGGSSPTMSASDIVVFEKFSDTIYMCSVTFQES